MSFSGLNSLGLAEPDLQHKSGSQVRVLLLHQGSSNWVLRNLLCGLLKKQHCRRAKQKCQTSYRFPQKKQKPCSFFLFCVLRNWIHFYLNKIDRGKKKENHCSYPTHNIALKWLDNIGVVMMLVHYFFPVLITDLINLRRRKANYSKQKYHYHL